MCLNKDFRGRACSPCTHKGNFKNFSNTSKQTFYPRGTAIMLTFQSHNKKFCTQNITHIISQSEYKWITIPCAWLKSLVFVMQKPFRTDHKKVRKTFGIQKTFSFKKLHQISRDMCTLYLLPKYMINYWISVNKTMIKQTWDDICIKCTKAENTVIIHDDVWLFHL